MRASVCAEELECPGIGLKPVGCTNVQPILEITSRCATWVDTTLTKDHKKAAECYEPSILMGSCLTDPFVFLGRMFEEGRGVSKDLSRARSLYTTAALRGSTDAEARLKALL